MPLSIDKYKRIYRRNPIPEIANYETELEFSREQFKNVKFAFLEQENKEKFIRSLTDNERVLEQSDIDEMAAEAAARKQLLQKEKRNVEQVSAEVQQLARKVVEVDAALAAKRQRRQELQEALDAARSKRQRLQQEQSHDIAPEDVTMVSMSLPDLQQRLHSSKEEVASSAEMLQQVRLELVPQLRQELKQRKIETGALQGELLKATTQAEQAVAERERLQGRHNDKEKLSLWLKSSLAALENE